jgi:hypothetical protein
MCESIIELLKDCIEQNYEDFKAKTIATLNKQEIFELAGQISAIEDVLFFLSTHDWLDEGEAEYLLTIDDPLEVLADEWKDVLSDSGCHFRQALEPLLGRYCGDGCFEYEYDFDEIDFDDYV